MSFILDTEFSDFIGNSPEMEAVKVLIFKAAQCKATVLITGASGTGKTVVSHAIHYNSEFAEGPFISVNCGAIPFNLIESELFGYEKGAFTGALNRTKGKFELAQNGTIFLDEIGELPIDAQVKLLRVLQQKEIIRVGGAETIKLNLRVITATNRNLIDSIEEGRFRIDLFYRIALFLIDLPNLQNRKEDIIPLAKHFLNKYAKLEQLPVAKLGPDAENFLKNHSWPGNVRQLENCMYRSVLMNYDKSILTAEDIMLLDHKRSAEELRARGQFSNEEVIPLEELEARMLKKALIKAHGNMVEAANMLKIARSTLYSKIEKHGLGALTKGKTNMNTRSRSG
ncbi:sigma-54 dependent transcriptional regulator [Deltaproteobacteria bacterium TL4]